ncbi:F0F1 ATP synthase subunit B [uncultured Rubinisphaera sp.]|uniref:F0F1 ATP synthase subunit B n=1 Tax=uncultured Rubinisphaera sp. TaxID=1678686 RepID=UPI0030DDD086
MKLVSTFAVLTALFCLMSGSVSAYQPEGAPADPHATSSPDGHDDHAGLDHHDELHGEHDVHHSHPGEPAGEVKPFDPKDWRLDLSIYSFVVFLLLLAALTKFAWGPIVTALDEREENIRKNIEDAEVARIRAEEMLAAHAAKLDAVQDEVREILAEARRDAEHTKSEILASAQKESELTKNRGIEEINRARDQALDELFRTISTQVTDATEHVIGRALNEEDRNRLIDESLAQLSKI